MFIWMVTLLFIFCTAVDNFILQNRLYLSIQFNNYPRTTLPIQNIIRSGCTESVMPLFNFLFLNLPFFILLRTQTRSVFLSTQLNNQSKTKQSCANFNSDQFNALSLNRNEITWQ